MSRQPRYTPEESEIYRTNTFGINCEGIKPYMKKPLKHDSPSQKKPIAIFMVGPPGSGKTYLLETHLLPETFQYDYYNVDEYYEPLLKLELKTDKDSLMKLAKECINYDYNEMVKNRKNMVLDRAGGRAYSIIRQKEELEKKGYKTYMVAIYTPSNLSIARDKLRGDVGGRTLGEHMVKKLWSKVMSSLLYYKEQFGENFILIDNSHNETQIDPHPEIKSHFGYNINIKKHNNTLEFIYDQLAQEKLKKTHQGKLPLHSIEHSKDIIKQKIHEFLTQ